MALGVYGKHPARGDFLEHGLPEGLRPALEGWLDATLSEARTALGAEWEWRWATAPALRFWLGEAIWGRPVAGVMAPAQDRVGRRFPLVLLALDSGLQPPALAPDQPWYDRAEAHLAALLRQTELAGPAAVAEGIEDPPAVEPVLGADFWAVREGADLAGLWADVAALDHRRAATGRSYWWVAGAPIVPEFVADPVPPAPAPEAATTEADAAWEPLALLPVGTADAAALAEAVGLWDTDPVAVAEVQAEAVEADPVPPEAADRDVQSTADSTTTAGEEADGSAPDSPALAPAETVEAELADLATAEPTTAEPTPIDLSAAEPPAEGTDPAGVQPALDPSEATDFAVEDDSPFSDSPFSEGGGLGLFAPPEPGTVDPLDQPGIAATLPPTQAAHQPPTRPAYSQIWAGPGLPPGQVIAWLLRGFQQNG